MLGSGNAEASTEENKTPKNIEKRLKTY